MAKSCFMFYEHMTALSTMYLHTSILKYECLNIRIEFINKKVLNVLNLAVFYK